MLYSQWWYIYKQWLSTPGRLTSGGDNWTGEQLMLLPKWLDACETMYDYEHLRIQYMRRVGYQVIGDDAAHGFMPARAFAVCVEADQGPWMGFGFHWQMERVMKFEIRSPNFINLTGFLSFGSEDEPVVIEDDE